jgi:hypothetical protein
VIDIDGQHLGSPPQSETRTEDLVASTTVRVSQAKSQHPKPSSSGDRRFVAWAGKAVCSLHALVVLRLGTPTDEKRFPEDSRGQQPKLSR